MDRGSWLQQCNRLHKLLDRAADVGCSSISQEDAMVCMLHSMNSQSTAKCVMSGLHVMGKLSDMSMYPDMIEVG